MSIFPQVYIPIAVAPSPMPWMDVFAIREIFNMAVTESGLDPQGPKNVLNFLMTVRPLS